MQLVDHVNNKNYVGLSVAGDCIACESEQDVIYAFSRNSPKLFVR